MKSFQKFSFGALDVYQFNFNLLGGYKLGVHLFFIDGLLIDTGPSRMSKLILNTFKNKIPVQQVFLTHHHEDHSGNLKQFKELYNCPVYATPSCCLMMKKPPPISLAQRIYWGDRPPYHGLIPIQNKIETDNYSFEIIPAPGHAVDMAVLYEPQKKWMFVADLYVSYHINYFLENESMAEQISSIKKVLSYDWEFMFCSHNPNIMCHRNELKAKLQFLETFYKNVSKLFHHCLLYTSPSPRDRTRSRMPSSA